jgi:ubiquinone/menaquinone biosynthesis C-methylase UbiE
MPARTDEVWKTSALVAVYLEGVRGAIPLAEEQIDIMLRLLRACGQPLRRFLDLGSGDGVLAAAILERYPGAEGVVADFSAPMLDAARCRFAQQKVSVRFANVDYGLTSWTQSVAEYGPYDAVVSGYSIHHQPDIRKREVYAEVFGLLSAGGIFVNVEHVSSASQWVEALHDDLFIDHLHRAHPGTSRTEVAENYGHRPDKAANILAPMELQCQWLRELGFTDVDCYLKVFELAVFGGRRPRRRVLETLPDV